jgi:hypothetical protein
MAVNFKCAVCKIPAVGRDGCVPRYILIDEIEELHIMLCEECIEEFRKEEKIYEQQETEMLQEIIQERQKEMLEWDEQTKKDYFLLQQHGVGLGEFDEVTKRRLEKELGRK